MGSSPKKIYPADYLLTCQVCGIEKLAYGNFHRNGKPKTGFIYTCQDCVLRRATDAREREFEATLQAWVAHWDTPGRCILNFGEPPLFGTQVIYALIDPRFDTVRYVGCTGDPKRRFARHLEVEHDRRIIRTKLFNTYPVPPGAGPKEKELWVSSLRQEGLRPEMRIIEQVCVPSRTLERETRWICHFLHQGAALLNVEWPNVTYAAPLLKAIQETEMDYLGEPLESMAWKLLLRARYACEQLIYEWGMYVKQRLEEERREREISRQLYCAADVSERHRFLSDQMWMKKKADRAERRSKKK